MKKLLLGCSLLCAYTLNAQQFFLDDNEKYGVKDEYGTVIVPGRFDDKRNFKEGMAAVSINGKWGYIDSTGKVELRIDYDKCLDFYEGAGIVEFDGKQTFVDKRGRALFSEAFTRVRPYSEGIAAVYSYSAYLRTTMSLDAYKWGFINKKGQSITHLEYDEVESFRNGMAPVKKDGKWGYVNAAGRKVIPVKYDAARSFNEDGLAMVKLNGKYGYVDKTGRIVIPIKYESIQGMREGVTAVRSVTGWGYVDKNGKQIVDCQYARVFPFQYGFAAVIPIQKCGIIDMSGKTIVSCKYDLCGVITEKLAWVLIKKGNATKYGFADLETGKEIVPPRYDVIGNRHIDGMLPLVLNGKYGLFNIYTRKEILAPEYDEFLEFSEGLCAAKKNGYWGYVNENGKVVIPFIYDQAESFFESAANVVKNGKKLRISMQGKILQTP